MRASGEPAAFAESVAWLKVTLEQLRTGRDPELVRAAEDYLVQWLVARNRHGDEA